MTSRKQDGWFLIYSRWIWSLLLPRLSAVFLEMLTRPILEPGLKTIDMHHHLLRKAVIIVTFSIFVGTGLFAYAQDTSAALVSTKVTGKEVLIRTDRHSDRGGVWHAATGRLERRERGGDGDRYGDRTADRNSDRTDRAAGDWRSTEADPGRR